MKKRLWETTVSNNGGGWVRGRLIGNGGCGSVYLATRKSSNRVLPAVMAMKSVDVSHSNELLKEKSFLCELRGCPNIIECFGDDVTKKENGDMFCNLLLEYASGGTLDDLIMKSNGYGLPELTVRYYTKSILQGLRHVHECNIVHSDLKPANILLVPHVTPCGTEFIPKIGDFGLAKRAKESKDYNLEGTPMYLSPEAIKTKIQEQPSDIWALGCVVVKMLTGKPPWEMEPGSQTVDLVYRIGYEPQYSPVIPSDLSKEGKDFLRCCFARNPEDRLTAVSLLNHPFMSKLDGMCEVLTTDKKISHMSWARRARGFLLCHTQFDGLAGV